MGMNFDQARFNMVEQQVRTWEVLDQRVLDVISTVQRELFVPAKHRKLAYADLMLPIGHEQAMLKPVVEGRLLQALEIKPDDNVLEIGTGTGYLSACLAELAAEVLSVEIQPELMQIAEQNIKRASRHSIELQQGDVLADWEPGKTFDVIVVSGSVREVPTRFLEWVKPNGRIFTVCGDDPVMEAVVMTKTEEGWATESVFETILPRLIGAEDSEEFSL